MPEVLVFIDWFYPAYKAGGPIQSIANLIDHQLDGIRYRVICSNKDLDSQPTDVQPNRWIKKNPWTFIFYSSTGTERSLFGAEDHILFINGIYSWHFNIRPILFAKARRKIVSARGMLHAEALAQKSFKKKIFIGLWKLARIHHKVEFHASSQIEAKAVRAVFGENAKVHLAANFPRVFHQQAIASKRKGELSLVSVALISPMKNILLVLQALKKVEARVHYHLYGPVKEKDYWQSCLAAIKELPPNVTVTYHGDVHPSKVEDALRNGQVFILPSKSENFAHAIYEALSAGKPVITSQNVPWHHLKDSEAGVNVAVDTTNELEEAILFFAAMNTTEMTQWGNGAKRYSESAIDMQAIKQQYRDMFGSARNDHPPEQTILKNEKS